MLARFVGRLKAESREVAQDVVEDGEERVPGFETGGLLGREAVSVAAIRSLTLPLNQSTKAEQLSSMHLAPVLIGAGQVLGACEAPELLTTSR